MQTSYSDLVDRDPLLLSDQDIDVITSYHRERRLLVREDPKALKKPKKDLDQLDLSGAEDL